MALSFESKQRREITEKTEITEQTEEDMERA